MSKHRKQSGRVGSARATDSFSQSWTDIHDPNTTRGVSADASGVGIWHSSGPSPNDGSGRQFSWDEWYREGWMLLSAPDGALARIDEVAQAHGIRAPKRASARPLVRREDLDIAEPSAEEQQRARLRHLFGDEN